MNEDRVKDPLGDYEATKAKHGPAPMSDLGGVGRIVGVLLLAVGGVGLLVYGLLF